MAISEYNKVIELCPDYSWAYFNLGSIAFEKRDYDSAVANLEKTIELNPRDVAAYKIYSQILIKLDKLDEARHLIQSAISENQYEGDLFYILAQIYKMQNEFENYAKALKISLKNYKTLSFSPKLIKKELDDLLSA